MSRLYALSKSIHLNHPLIIDDFRGGELSTLKEDLILDEFKQLNNQVIMTCTLKHEEQGKYDDMDGIFNISFDHVEKFHLLNAADVEKADLILKELNITTNN